MPFLADTHYRGAALISRHCNGFSRAPSLECHRSMNVRSLGAICKDAINLRN